MPEYLAPGVYVEEFEIGAKPIEGVATSTLGILGEAERGPSEPLLVTSFPDYQRKFGGYFGETKYLPYAVKGFFDNGGARAYVARLVSIHDPADSAVKAEKVLVPLTIRAIGEGAWGSRVFITIEQVAVTPTKNVFKLTIDYYRAGAADPANDDPAFQEIFEDLEVDESSPNFVDKRINHGNSNLIHIEVDAGAAALPADVADQALDDVVPVLDGAMPLLPADYTGRSTIGERTGLEAFNESRYDNVAIMYGPGVSDPAGYGPIVSHCELSKYRFAVIDSNQNDANIANIKPRDDRDTKYAAYYYPWIRVIDAATGARKEVPPGGHVCGIYARTDIERGVWKAPANEVVRGAVELKYKIDHASQEVLNPAGVNVIRPFPGRGRRVWGARTMSSDAAWKYVNVRRFFIYLEASIFRGTQWVVFEPNNESLWARVRQTIEQFLRTQWRAGALMGTKEGEAFFVKCDRTTMTQDDIDNGRLIVVIGVAPVKPAEFVIFRIAQFAGGSET